MLSVYSISSIEEIFQLYESDEWINVVLLHIIHIWVTIYFLWVFDSFSKILNLQFLHQIKENRNKIFLNQKRWKISNKTKWNNKIGRMRKYISTCRYTISIFWCFNIFRSLLIHCKKNSFLNGKKSIWIK